MPLTAPRRAGVALLGLLALAATGSAAPPAGAAVPITLPFGPVQLDAATPFSFTLDLEALPPRPVLHISVDPEDLQFGDHVVCNGPQGETDSFSAAVNEEIEIYRIYAGGSLGPTREGVVCEVTLNPFSGSGLYTLAITASSPRRTRR